jgi:hypothetical protein
VIGVISAISSRNSVPLCASSNAPGRRAIGARERALLVTEQLGLEERVGDRRAVERHERLRRARTELVEGLRNQFFARAGLAMNEHGRGRRRRLFHDLVDLAHLETRADQPSERAALLKLAPQRPHFTQRVISRGDLIEHDPEPLGIDRLGEVVVRALLDRLNRRFDRPLCREQHDGDVRVVLAFQGLSAGPFLRGRASPCR